MKIKKVRLEDIDTQAITGAITNIEFLRKVRNKLNPGHLKSKYGGEVLKWVYEYYDKYEKAPEKEIQRIFAEKKGKLKDKNNAKLIELYLNKLSEDYTKQSSYNCSYLYDKLIPYIRKRDIEALAETLTKYAERDDIVKASEALVDFQLVHKETSGIFNPFDPEHIEATFELSLTGIMTLPGALGELIGPLDRGWLVSFTAPEKRGKTWWLIEMAFQALSQGLKVLFISLEMLTAEINHRLWKRLTAGADRKFNRKVYVPVFDCDKNQVGECEREERKGPLALFDADTGALLRGGRGYKTCTACQGKKGSDFSLTFWYEKVRVKEYTKSRVFEKAKLVEKMFGSNLRVKCFPAFTANSKDIRAILNELDVNEGFAADVLIVDYNDILATESSIYSERGSIDATWKTAKGVAQEKSLLYLTVDQSSKITYKRDIRLYDTSEDKRKNAHVDAKIAMNKLQGDSRHDELIEVPKEEMPEDIEVLRFSVIAHRHLAFKAHREVMVLQQRGIGQPLIDSAWYKK